MSVPHPHLPLGGTPVLGLEAPVPPQRWLQRPVRTRRSDRDLAGHLDRELDGLGTVLHDVRFPNGTVPVDHVVVAPSGIWLIDSIHVSGRVERRRHGDRRDAEPRLYVGGVERSDLVDQLGILRSARNALRAMGFGDIPTHRVVCVIDATWPLSGRPFQVGSVWVVWPRALTDKIRSSGLLRIARAKDIAATISQGVTASV